MLLRKKILPITKDWAIDQNMMLLFKRDNETSWYLHTGRTAILRRQCYHKYSGDPWLCTIENYLFIPFLGRKTIRCIGCQRKVPSNVRMIAHFHYLSTFGSLSEHELLELVTKEII